jgi:hypothetical protein
MLRPTVHSVESECVVCTLRHAQCSRNRQQRIDHLRRMHAHHNHMFVRMRKTSQPICNHCQWQDTLTATTAHQLNAYRRELVGIRKTGCCGWQKTHTCTGTIRTLRARISIKICPGIHAIKILLASEYTHTRALILRTNAQEDKDK